jgi:hypothetical protein
VDAKRGEEHENLDECEKGRGIEDFRRGDGPYIPARPADTGRSRFFMTVVCPRPRE